MSSYWDCVRLRWCSWLIAADADAEETGYDEGIGGAGSGFLEGARGGDDARDDGTVRLGEGTGGMTFWGDGMGGITGGSPLRGSNVGYVRLRVTELGVRGVFGVFVCVDGDRRGVFDVEDVRES